jgi:hypothetical protein
MLKFVPRNAIQVLEFDLKGWFVCPFFEERILAPTNEPMFGKRIQPILRNDEVVRFAAFFFPNPYHAFFGYAKMCKPLELASEAGFAPELHRQLEGNIPMRGVEGVEL